MAKIIIKKTIAPATLYGTANVNYIVIACFASNGHLDTLPTIVAYCPTYQHARRMLNSYRAGWYGLGYNAQDSIHRNECKNSLNITNWREFSEKVLAE